MTKKKKGLWANIHAKRKRGEAPAKKGDKNYPETLDIDEGSMKQARKNVGADKCWDGYKAKGTKKKDGKSVPNCVKEGKTLSHFCAEAAVRGEKDSKKRKAKIDKLERLMKAVEAPKAVSDVGEEVELTSEGYKELPKRKMGMKAGKKIISAIGHAAKAGEAGEGEIEDQVRTQKANKKGKQAQKIHDTASSHKPSKSKLKEIGNKLKGMRKEDVTLEDAEGNTVAEIVDLIKPEPMTGWRQQVMSEISEDSQEYMADVLEAAWTKKAGKSEAGGLNEKGRKSYERENPGSDLKAPSKKVGNPRRKSFCARMKGMRKRQKPENNTGDDRLSKSLRAWNC